MSYRSADTTFLPEWKDLLEQWGDPDPWKNPLTKKEGLNQDATGLLRWAQTCEGKIPYWMGRGYSEGFTLVRCLWFHKRAQAIRIYAKLRDLPVSVAVRNAPLPAPTSGKRGPSHLTDWETPFHSRKDSPLPKKQRCTPPGSPTYSDLTSTADVIYAADVPLSVEKSPGPSPSPPASPSDVAFQTHCLNIEEGPDREGGPNNPIVID